LFSAYTVDLQIEYKNKLGYDDFPAAAFVSV